MKKFLILLVLLLLAGCSETVNRQVGGDTTINDVSAAKLEQKYNLATEIKAKYQLKESSLKQIKIVNPELDKYKGEPKDEVSVQIGDSPTGLLGGAADFEPSITLKRWNEVSFKIKPKDLDKIATKDKTLSLEGDKIKFGTPKMNFEMYDYTDGEGGYKYIWYLNEKPLINKVEFQIEDSGLDFFYQPALNTESYPEADNCTETQCFKDGQVIIERPENVVGSYAVYHSTKGGMNDIYGKDYKTGKAFHIYRPHIIDAEGKETWGILHIENGIYSVEIPQDFLDKAVYPIKSNDTFGYTSAGESQNNICSRYSTLEYKSQRRGTTVAGAAGTLDKLSAYLWTTDLNDTVDISYFLNTKDSEGSDSHGQVVRLQGTYTGPTSATLDELTAASQSLSAVNYVISAVADAADMNSEVNYKKTWLCYDTGSAIYDEYYEEWTGSTGYNSVGESPWTETPTANTTYHFSIYATYTASGGATTPATPTVKINSPVKINSKIIIK
jgi:hypothetical protein